MTMTQGVNGLWLPDELEQVARTKHYDSTGARADPPRRGIKWPSTVTITDDPTNDSKTLAISGVVPGGAAGGALDGNYPNPGIAASVAGNGLAEAADVLSVNVDGVTIEIVTDTLNVKNTSGWAGWTSWTPGISGTGWALGNGTVSGQYFKVGRTVFFRGSVVFGSTSTFGANPVKITGLPFTCVARAHITHFVECFDSSAIDIYYARAVVNTSTTDIVFWPVRADATYLKNLSTDPDVKSTVPMTWAVSDSLTVEGFYEATS